MTDRDMPPVDYVMDVIRTSHERMHTLKDVYETASYLFMEPNYDLPALEKFRSNVSPDVLGHSPNFYLADVTQIAFYAPWL